MPQQRQLFLLLIPTTPKQLPHRPQSGNNDSNNGRSNDDDYISNHRHHKNNNRNVITINNFTRSYDISNNNSLKAVAKVLSMTTVAATTTTSTTTTAATTTTATTLCCFENWTFTKLEKGENGPDGAAVALQRKFEPTQKRTKRFSAKSWVCQKKKKKMTPDQWTKIIGTIEENWQPPITMKHPWKKQDSLST